MDLVISLTLLSLRPKTHGICWPRINSLFTLISPLINPSWHLLSKTHHCFLNSDMSRARVSEKKSDMPACSIIHSALRPKIETPAYLFQSPLARVENKYLISAWSCQSSTFGGEMACYWSLRSKMKACRMCHACQAAEMSPFSRELVQWKCAHGVRLAPAHFEWTRPGATRSNLGGAETSNTCKAKIIRWQAVSSQRRRMSEGFLSTSNISFLYNDLVTYCESHWQEIGPLTRKMKSLQLMLWSVYFSLDIQYCLTKVCLFSWVSRERKLSLSVIIFLFPCTKWKSLSGGGTFKEIPIVRHHK